MPKRGLTEIQTEIRHLINELDVQLEPFKITFKCLIKVDYEQASISEKVKFLNTLIILRGLLCQKED